MTIVEINTCNYGSTGRIMINIAETASDLSHTCYICIPKGRHNKDSTYPNTIWIGNRIVEDSHTILSRITGFTGCFSIFATISLLEKLHSIKPDVLHLHNLHEAYINLPLLFRFIKKNNIKTIWTLHDCWSFTGHCAYFSFCNCDKWKYGCSKCELYRQYPKSYIDNSRYMWKLKKRWFTGINNLTIVTPSLWLKALVKESFLKDYPVVVINNGVDLDDFKPRYSTFRLDNKINNKIVLLGVAFAWGERKGLDIFIELAKRLSNNYVIVLVGTDESVDQLLPDNIVSIHRTKNPVQLAEIYSAADIFINPTREDNYPTVNMEAIACGTPVITFNTGGSSEIIINERCGLVLNNNNLDELVEAIHSVSNGLDNTYNDCFKYASLFDAKKKYYDYIKLYEDR